nr:hypothetical protein [Candidatus Enterousia merdequi]
MTEKTTEIKKVKFTKKDLLTAKNIVAILRKDKLDVSIEDVNKSMKNMYLRGTSFTINRHSSPVILNSVTKRLHVHPAGFNIFKQYLENKIKEK